MPSFTSARRPCSATRRLLSRRNFFLFIYFLSSRPRRHLARANAILRCRSGFSFSRSGCRWNTVLSRMRRIFQKRSRLICAIILSRLNLSSDRSIFVFRRFSRIYRQITVKKLKNSRVFGKLVFIFRCNIMFNHNPLLIFFFI